MLSELVGGTEALVRREGPSVSQLQEAESVLVTEWSKTLRALHNKGFSCVFGQQKTNVGRPRTLHNNSCSYAHTV